MGPGRSEPGATREGSRPARSEACRINYGSAELVLSFDSMQKAETLGPVASRGKKECVTGLSSVNLPQAVDSLRHVSECQRTYPDLPPTAFAKGDA